MVDRTDSLSVLRAVARDFQPLSGPYELTFETHAGLQRSGATWGSVQAPCAHVLMLALYTQCFLLVVALLPALSSVSCCCGGGSS